MKDLLFYFVLPLAIGSWWFQHSAPAPDVDTVERIYYMHFGGLYCARREMTPCGIRLSNCADTNIYECMHDVHWEP